MIHPPSETSDLQRLLGPVLASVSRSFYLSIKLLPSAIQSTVSLAYLFARTSDTVADAPVATPQSSSALLAAYSHDIANGTLRDSTRQALLETPTFHPGERELLSYAALSFDLFALLPSEQQSLIKSVLTKIISGQIYDRERFPNPANLQFLKHEGELEEYTYLVAGCVGEFWTEIVHLLPDQNPPSRNRLHQARLFGQALQLINIVRDVGADLAIGRCYFPATELEAAGIPLNRDFIRHPRFAHIHRRWTHQARTWLAHATRYVNETSHFRLRLAAWLPAALGHKTLDLIERHPTVPEHKLKVSRGCVYREMLASFFRCL
jgi:farnesyl-diphosphate farnesyltransferase